MAVRQLALFALAPLLGYLAQYIGYVAVREGSDLLLERL
jgi:hypothetical protein